MFEVETAVVNRSLGNENGELAGKKPFEIRGHHLKHFYYLDRINHL